MLGFVHTFWRFLQLLLEFFPLLLRQPPPVPAFLVPAFAVRRARICFVSVFGLVTSGQVGLLKLVMGARMVCISVFGSLTAGAGIGADDWFA